MLPLPVMLPPPVMLPLKVMLPFPVMLIHLLHLMVGYRNSVTVMTYIVFKVLGKFCDLNALPVHYYDQTNAWMATGILDHCFFFFHLIDEIKALETKQAHSL